MEPVVTVIKYADEKAKCPRCGHEQQRQDYLGILHCHSCGFCAHPVVKFSEGIRKCTVCGERVSF